MIQRQLTQKLKQAAKQFPIVVITGSRQSGKTITSDYFRHLNYWKKLTPKKTLAPFLIYGGDQDQRRKSITLLGWNNLTALYKQLT